MPDNPDEPHLTNRDRHDAYAALRYRNFRLYLAGSFISSAGMQMQSVAVGWELYERTGSAMALGLVGLAQVLPMFLFTLPAGHVADQFNRRTVLLAGQILLMLCSLGLAAVSYSQGPVWLIYVLLFLIGTSQAFKNPSRASLMPQLVPLSIFSNAATWSSTSFQLASVAGPALGGVIIAAQKGATAVYLIDAVAAMTFFVFVLMLRLDPFKRAAEPVSLKTLAAGFHFVYGNTPILAAITLDMFAVLFGGATALLPIYAKDILQVGPTGFGWLRAAPYIGAITMSILIAHLPPFKRAGRALLLAVAAFGVCIVIFGLSRTFWLSLVLLMLAEAFDTVSVVIRHTLVQVRTPDQLRGRVSAVNGVFISSSNELGAFESGAVAQIFSPTVSVVSGGIGTILVVLAVAFTWPQIRRLGTLHEGLDHGQASGTSPSAEEDPIASTVSVCQNEDKRGSER